MHFTRRLTGALAAAALVLTLTATPATAQGARRANHCFNPAGIDLNETYETDDAFVTAFCGDGHVGDWWRPLLRWVGAPTHDVIPEDYEPVGETPQLDFLAKLASARYVVDAGTAREQTLTFEADELVIVTGTLPDGSEFVAFTPRLHPLTPGDHTIDRYATMSAETWDGLGLDEEHRLPPGELLLGSVTLTVHAGAWPTASASSR
jgi:hypothetical protein